MARRWSDSRPLASLPWSFPSFNLEMNPMRGERTFLHNLPEQGPTSERPGSMPQDDLYEGCKYFDGDLGILIYWDGSEWRPLGVARGKTSARPSAAAVPEGTHYYNDDIESLQFSDGVTWLTYTVDDPQSSSSSTSSSSPSSQSSSSSSESSSQLPAHGSLWGP
jgi:hypothetical protein